MDPSVVVLRDSMTAPAQLGYCLPSASAEPSHSQRPLRHASLTLVWSPPPLSWGRNAIWQAVLRGDVDIADAREKLHLAIPLYRRIAPLEGISDSALELASRLRHPIHDCFYPALAERERCALITADGWLIAAAKAVRGIELRVP